MKAGIKAIAKGQAIVDGAGVHLVRVLGHSTVKEFDPILMLDSFDSYHPDDYTAGFPMHPHRGIETISYLSSGKMLHKDSLGNSDTISDGEVQWMCAGSGILHEEQVPSAKHLLGVQLWLNLPSDEKMAKPAYHRIKREEIMEIAFPGGMLRLLAGSYQQYMGFQGAHHPLDYYDIHLQADAQFHTTFNVTDTIILFTLSQGVYINNQWISEKTAVVLSDGDEVELIAKDHGTQVLFLRSCPLREPIAWGGPIVMNTKELLQHAFDELQQGTFLKGDITY